MGYSRTDKADSRARIVKTAAGAFREHGLDGIGVADIMRAAGLTHGGFYRHFGSRGDLVDAAVVQALQDGSAAADAIARNPGASIDSLIDGYLSLVHRDNVAAGCAVAGLANDVARAGTRSRAAYAAQVERYVALITGFIAHLPPAQRRASALGALATLVGAVAMARAVDDEALSREILQAAAAELKGRLAR